MTRPPQSESRRMWLDLFLEMSHPLRLMAFRRNTLDKGRSPDRNIVRSPFEFSS